MRQCVCGKPIFALNGRVCYDCALSLLLRVYAQNPKGTVPFMAWNGEIGHFDITAWDKKLLEKKLTTRNYAYAKAEAD